MAAAVVAAVAVVVAAAVVVMVVVCDPATLTAVPLVSPPSGPLHPAGEEEAQGPAPLPATCGAHRVPALGLCLLPPGGLRGAHHVREKHAAQLPGSLQLYRPLQLQLDRKPAPEEE